MNKVKFTLLCRLMLASLMSGALLQPVQAAPEGDKEILYWVAPMDPNYRRDKPGKSPMGMDLTPVYAGADEGGSAVSISPQIVQSLGIRTAKAERSRLWRGIDTVGYVDHDESKVSHIHLRTKGWVENLAVKSEGERVARGQRLFDVYSPELVNAQEEFIQVLSTGNKSLQRASRDRLSALGIAASQIKKLERNRRVQQLIPIFAQQDGVVATLPVREGMYVMPSMRVMSLVDLSSVWLMAEVFERQTDWVNEGDLAEVRLPYLPGRVWEGRVEYIYPDLDPKTRTLKVRIRFDNPGEMLKPNMYGNVRIFGGAKQNVVVVPVEALIRTGREERLILAKGDGRFEARKVRAGVESGDWVEIAEGLREGEMIVVSGQFLIDSEASMKASLTRMSEPEAEPAMDMPSQTATVMGNGVVKAVKAGERKVTLQHEPIVELEWPAMTMDFAVSDEVDLQALSAGEPVMFELEDTGKSYVIRTIHATAGKEMQP